MKLFFIALMAMAFVLNIQPLDARKALLEHMFSMDCYGNLRVLPDTPLAITFDMGFIKKRNVGLLLV